MAIFENSIVLPGFPSRHLNPSLPMDASPFSAHTSHHTCHYLGYWCSLEIFRLMIDCDCAIFDTKRPNPLVARFDGKHDMILLISQTDHHPCHHRFKPLQHITSSALCNSSNDRLSLEAAPSPLLRAHCEGLASLFHASGLEAYVKISQSPASPHLLDALAVDLQTPHNPESTYQTLQKVLSSLALPWASNLYRGTVAGAYAYCVVVALPQLRSSSSLTPRKRGTAGQCARGVSHVWGGRISGAWTLA